MLWSLLKVLIFFGLVAMAAFGFGMLTDASGGMQIQVAGNEFTLTALQSVVALIVLMAACYVLFKVASFSIALLRFINGDETAISRYFDRNRERRGFTALSEAMMALASGEGKVAMAKAARAERYLDKPELTNLVAAQAAEMTGDRKKAEDVYKRLLKDDRTRFVGVRGLLKQRLSDGDTETALKLAEKAFALKPKHVETSDTLLKLQASEEDWAGARETLGAKLKHGSLPRDVHRRRDAVMALSEARNLRLNGKIDEAQELAIEANRLSPELVPGATMAAHAYVEQDKGKYATRVLKAAWDKSPHPELAAAFAAIEPNESTEARLKRFKALSRSNASDPETRMVMAELHISAEDFPAARKAMVDLATKDPSMRALTIMAAIARGEGAEDREVRSLLTQALSAPRDPAWICENCNHVHEDWHPVCEDCGAIDTLSWERPPSVDVQSAGAQQMLPLIVGQLEDQRDAAEEIPEAVIEVITADEADVSVPTSEAAKS